jgi:hypothetical protein
MLKLPDDPLPVLPQLSFPAHVGHVVARLANGAGEDGRAIALDMLIEPDAGLGDACALRPRPDGKVKGAPKAPAGASRPGAIRWSGRLKAFVSAEVVDVPPAAPTKSI